MTNHIDTSGIDSVVGYNLRRAAARQRDRFRSVFGPFDVRPVLLTALSVIYFNEGLSQSELGRALDMKRGNVVTLLHELKQRGLIVRKRSRKDRRVYEVHLTAKGIELTQTLLNLHEKLEADLASALGREDLALLVELLRRFRAVESAPNLD